jgi:hypothetical protein
MVACLGTSETEDGRGEEHGLVVGVGDKQANAFAAQLGESRLDEAGHEPIHDWDENDAKRGEVEEAVHLGGEE